VLTVALGWRADWWALVPLTIVAGVAIARLVPAIVHADDGDNPALNPIVLAATLVAALIPVGLGLGMLFVRTSRAAFSASPLASHGRTSALLSVGRLVGATVGAGLAGIALSGTLTASTVHRTLLFGAILCVVLGFPAATRLTARAAGRAGEAATTA
jgi:uncharacterized membrane protein YidH (DUF202 family)